MLGFVNQYVIWVFLREKSNKLTLVYCLDSSLKHVRGSRAIYFTMLAHYQNANINSWVAKSMKNTKTSCHDWMPIMNLLCAMALIPNKPIDEGVIIVMNKCTLQRQTKQPNKQLNWTKCNQTLFNSLDVYIS